MISRFAPTSEQTTGSPTRTLMVNVPDGDTATISHGITVDAYARADGGEGGEAADLRVLPGGIAAQFGGGGLPGEPEQETEEQPAAQQKPNAKQKPRKKKPTYMLGQKQPKAPSEKRNPLPIILGIAVTAAIIGIGSALN